MPVALDLVVVAHEPRHVLRSVLARLGREVPEPAVELHAHAPPELRIRGDARVEARVEILPVALETEDEGLVVEPGSEERDLLGGHADQLGHVLGRELHRVAEPDDVLRRRAAVDEPAQHGHRIRVVEQPGGGAELGHLLPEREHVVGGPQRPEDAADAERVGDRLPQPVAGRDIEVEQGRLVPADLHHVDHVVRTVECRPALRMGRDRRVGATLAGDVAGHRLRRREPVGVDVVQRDLDAP